MPSGGGFRFGPFLLDPRSRCLLRGDVVIPLQPRLFDLLEVLVSRAGELLTKDELIKVGWPRHEVADNNLTQAISRLRTTLDADEPERYIQTVPRRGYRFVAPASSDDAGLTDAELDAMMAPHVALLDGRTMLETLASDRIETAIALFTRLVARDGRKALNHVGLANASVLRYEATRAMAEPDFAALRLAVTHAREARRLAPTLGEAWATYGFVIERTGDRRGAVGALIHATTLEPDNWAHHLRLAWCTWGEPRLGAARRTLELRRGLAIAHWLMATVYSARNDLAAAEREVDAALDAMSSAPRSGFSGAAICWLKGLLCLARDAEDEAMAFFDRELELEPLGHLYGRECCASAWYAKGGVYWRRGNADAALAAFAETLSRVPGHAMAQAGMQVVERMRERVPAAGAGLREIGGGDGRLPHDLPMDGPAADALPLNVDHAMARAVLNLDHRDASDGPRLVHAALTAADPGSAGWLLPLDPLLDIQRNRAAWGATLSALHERTFVLAKL